MAIQKINALREKLQEVAARIPQDQAYDTLRTALIDLDRLENDVDGLLDGFAKAKADAVAKSVAAEAAAVQVQALNDQLAPEIAKKRELKEARLKRKALQDQLRDVTAKIEELDPAPAEPVIPAVPVQ